MTKPTCSCLLFLLFNLTVESMAIAAPQGVMILTSTSGDDPRNLVFIDQIWTDFDGGTVVVDGTGQKSGFRKRDIARIVYFDPQFYLRLNSDPSELAFREGIQAREIVTDTTFRELKSAEDVSRVESSRSALAWIDHEYPSVKDLVGPELAILEGAQSNLSKGLVLQDGEWITRQEAMTRDSAPSVGQPIQRATFTTKDGRKFSGAQVTAADTGVSVLTPDGGATIPFSQLPDNLSVFPSPIREIIKQKEARSPAQEQSLPQLPSPQKESTQPSPLLVSDSTSSDQQKTGSLGAIWIPLTAADKIDALQSNFDKDLPSDVITALSFIRQKMPDLSNFIGARIIVDPKTSTFIVVRDGWIQIVPIKDLNPSAIELLDKGIASHYYVISIYTTDRKPTAVSITFGKNSTVLSQEPACGIELPSSRPFESSRFTDERIVKALSDIINFYGGQEEDALDLSTTPQKLALFIKAKISKQTDDRDIDVGLEETTGKLWISGLPRMSLQTPTFISVYADKLEPDEFRWDKSGDGPSELTVMGSCVLTLPSGATENDHGFKLTCVDEEDASQVASALQKIAEDFGWKPSKY